MKVILKDDVENLGHLGDIKDVAAGYARNYLIPRGLVIAATSKNVAEVEHERRLIEVKLSARREQYQVAADKITALNISVSVKVGEDGRLFGSVTAKVGAGCKPLPVYLPPPLPPRGQTDCPHPPQTDRRHT